MPESAIDIRIQNKIKQWKDKLLDMTLRNKLLNFKETKKSTLSIEEPSIDILYKKLVVDEKTLRFDYLVIESGESEEEPAREVIKHGDIKTRNEIGELQQILRNIRSKAKTIKEDKVLIHYFFLWDF